ncbi:MAG TPA: maleylpyruvate isomerase family mycothiol-dependent enzyme [Longimicrobium sp.]|jgi:uncharacterized protein (TIGR03083 family)
MRPPGEVATAHLFPRLHEKLLEVLRALAPDDWERPTACSLWTVKDVAAHLLDGDLRRISVQRDGWFATAAPEPIRSHGELVAFLNALNAEWVAAARRISPALLTELLGFTGREAARMFAAADPRGPALFPVAWAGEERSAMWLDVAREYTERWLHQQHVRDAVGRPGIESRELYHPVLDAFLRALPHTYRHVEAADGTAVTVTVEGEAGGDWTAVREGGAWRLYLGRPERPAARVSMDGDAAWRLFTKASRGPDPRPRVRIDGDEALGRPVLGMVSVMA